MITLVVHAAGHAPADIARTLRAFVPAVVDGTIVDGVVVAADPAAFGEMADGFGVRLVADDGSPAWLADARGRHLLVIEAGAALEEGWAAAVERFCAKETTLPARFRIRAGRSLGSFFRRPKPLGRGLLMRRADAETAMRRGGGVLGLARGRAATTLAPRIVAAA